MSADHGQFSGIGGVSKARHGANLDRTIDRAMADLARAEREHDARLRAMKAAHVADEAARTKVTQEELDSQGATWVRDRFGWHEVVRTSAKSVTVRTPYSWSDRIPMSKVLDYR